MTGGQILTWSTVFKMKTRLSRLLCSKTFLLSILSFLGIFELGRYIFGHELTFQEYNENSVVNEKDLHIKLAVPNTKIEQNKETTLNKDNPEMAADEPVLAKNRKIVRHKILLLAYARYFLKSFCWSLLLLLSP